MSPVTGPVVQSEKISRRPPAPALQLELVGNRYPCMNFFRVVIFNTAPVLLPYMAPGAINNSTFFQIGREHVAQLLAVAHGAAVNVNFDIILSGYAYIAVLNFYQW